MSNFTIENLLPTLGRGEVMEEAEETGLPLYYGR